MGKMQIMLELNNQGELITTAEGKVLATLVCKGMAILNCDNLSCEKCPFENSSCGCVLLETEKQLKKLLMNS